MFIRAGIVRDLVSDLERDLVRDLVREHVRAALDRATFIGAEIVGDYFRVHFHSWDYQGLCQSHIDQTTIVRDHLRAALVIVE